MENPCKIVFFGDSIIKGCTPIFEKMLKEEYPDVQLEVINAGVSSETSRNGLKRVYHLVNELAHVVVIGFGMNDWRKGVSKHEFAKNLCQMIDSFEAVGTRVLLTTISPSYEGVWKGVNRTVDAYNDMIRSVSLTKRVKIADASFLWKREIKPVQRGLRDAIHPNTVGYKAICRSLMHVVPRRYTTVLWQYNGHEAKCNYRCPYCYYIGLHHPSDMFFGTIEQWHEGFKRSFENQHLAFYLAFGEPTIGGVFYDIVKMVGSEPNWELRMTSNVSQPMEELVRTKAARDGTLHINASFHPLAASTKNFLKKILFLREHGIEAPIVYVMYPPFLKRFESDIAVFNDHNFVVHVRRFQGYYKGREYPYAYNDAERRLIAKYSDDGMIKYMLNQQHNTGDLTYSGLHFFVVDSVGNIGYDSNVFEPYSKYRCIFGNIHQSNFRPLFEPGPYPGRRQGTVDGVANLVGSGYHELEGNNILSFARQGGVYKDVNGKVVYGNKFKNFDDPKVRAKYNFPPRNIQDSFAIMRYSKAPVIRQSLYRKAYAGASNIAETSPLLKNIAKKLLGK